MSGSVVGLKNMGYYDYYLNKLGTMPIMDALFDWPVGGDGRTQHWGVQGKWGGQMERECGGDQNTG